MPPDDSAGDARGRGRPGRRPAARGRGRGRGRAHRLRDARADLRPARHAERTCSTAYGDAQGCLAAQKPGSARRQSVEVADVGRARTLGHRGRGARRAALRRRRRRGRAGPGAPTSKAPGSSTRCSPTSPRDRAPGTYSIVARDGEPASSGSRCSRTGSRSARSSPGPGPGSARSPPSRSPSRPTARGCWSGSRRGEAARRRRSRPSSPRTRPSAFRQVAVVDAAGAVAVHTGDGCIAARRRPRGRRLQRPGEHDGLAGGLAGDGGGVRGAPTGPLARRLLAALEAAEEAGRRRPRPPVGGAARGPGAGRALGDDRSICGSRTRPSRSASCGGCSTSTTPTRSPTAPTSSPDAGEHERGRRRSTPRPPTRRRRTLELAFWAGLGIAAARRPRGGRRAGRGA